MINMNTINNSWQTINFDGVDERAKTGGNPTGISDTLGSISLWIKMPYELVNGSDPFLSLGGTNTADGASASGLVYFGRRTITGVDNRLQFFHRTQGSSFNEINGNTKLAQNNLYHVVVTSNGSTWKMYVNGVEETITVRVGSNTGEWFGDIGSVGTADFSIGQIWRNNEWTATYGGWLDDVLVTNNTLTQAQITALYNGGKPISPVIAGVNPANIRIYWKMGETENGTIGSIKPSIGNPAIDTLTTENMENADIISTNYY